MPRFKGRDDDFKIDDIDFIDAESENQLGQKVDYQKVLLRQLERISVSLSIGDFNSFNLGVEALNTLLYPYMDKTIKTALEETKSEFYKSLRQVHPKLMGQVREQLELAYQNERWSLLMTLMKRKGLIPEDVIIDTIE